MNYENIFFLFILSLLLFLPLPNTSSNYYLLFYQSYINCPTRIRKKEKIIDFPRLNPGINPKQPLHLVDRRIIKSRSTGIVQLSNLGRDRRPCL